MEKICKGLAVLLLAAAIGMALGGCGTRDGFGTQGGTDPVLNNPVSAVKTGAVATDSWGYTGAAAAPIAAPDKVELVLAGHTLLVDASNGVVSGVTPTSITLSEPAAVSSSFGTLLYSVDLSLGSATTSTPSPSLSVDVHLRATPGETLTAYNYDAGTRTWVSAHNAVVDSSGKVSFPVDRFSLWGIFR